MGKTEGNGCVNDFTREYASHGLVPLPGAGLDCTPAAGARRVALVMSGGTEGVLSPHFTVFARRRGRRRRTPAGEKRLVVGTAHTRDFAPEEIGPRGAGRRHRRGRAGRDARAGIATPTTCISCRSSARCSPPPRCQSALAARRGSRSRATPTSRWAIRAARRRWAWAVALGEVARRRRRCSGPARLARCTRRAPRPRPASNSTATSSSCWARRPAAPRLPHRAHGDARRHRRRQRAPHAARRFGLDPERDDDAHPARLVNLLAKAEASPDGRCAARATPCSTTPTSIPRAMRAPRSAACWLRSSGHTALYVSGGAEHQGPAGGGPVAAIFAIPSHLKEPHEQRL